MRKLCELLPAVNAGNWRDVLAAFDIQLRAEGRLDIDSWDLILERIGGVAGAGVLEETLKATGPVDQHRVAWLLKGWLGEDLDGGNGLASSLQRRKSGLWGPSRPVFRAQIHKRRLKSRHNNPRAFGKSAYRLSWPMRFNGAAYAERMSFSHPFGRAQTSPVL
jgi:hypothetical protein